MLTLNLRQKSNFITFLDVFISGIANQNLTLQTYHKSTYTEFPLKFKSFSSFSYKISLSKCLVDTSFKICNNWNSFHKYIDSIKSNLIKNPYTLFVIKKVIKNQSDHKFSGNQNQLKDTSDVYYFKIPYICNFLHHIKNKLSELCKEFCKENFNIKLVFNSVKIKSSFSYKDPILDDLKSFLVYKFSCASFSSSYISETCRHLKLGLRNISKRIASLIFSNTYTPLQHVLNRITLFLLK